MAEKAIGPGWVAGAWKKAGWIDGAWGATPELEVIGGVFTFSPSRVG